MGVYSHLPSGDWRNDGWALAGSGVTAAWQALSVDDDTKYVSSPPSKGAATVAFPVDITAVPAGAVITAATVKLRCATGAGSPPAGVTPSVTVATAAQDDTSQYTTRTVYPTATPTTYTVATYTRDALGFTWDIQRVNQILARVFSYGAVTDLVRVHKFYVDFTYRLAPSLTVDGPSGTVLTSSPTLSWTYSHPDGDTMAGLHYRLFTADQVAQISFDANLTSPVFEDHVIGDLASVLLPTSIDPNIYWVFARATSIFGAIGQWISRLFSIFGPSPCTPGVPDPTGTAPAGIGVIEVVPDSELGSATLSLQDTSNLLAVQAADAETTTDGTSFTLSNATVVRDTTAHFGSGVASWKLSSVASGDMTLYSDWTEVSAQGSGQLTARAQVKTAASARSVRIRILFYDSTFTLLSGTLTGSSITDATGTWTEATVTGAIPTTGVYARAAFDVLSTGGASEIHNLDHLSLSYGVSSPWSDGGHVSRNLLSNWYSTAEGTPQAGEAWTAGTASTVSTAAPTGTGASGSLCNTMTYAGITPTIAYRAAGTAWSTAVTGNGYTLNKPAGLVTGDLMIAFISASASTTLTPPTGWVLVDTAATTGATTDTGLYVLKRTAGGSEPASWTGTFASNVTRATGLVVAYSGAADASTQFVAEAVAADASATPLYVSTPTVSNTDPNAWRVSAFAVSDNASGGSLTANVAVPSTVPGIAYVGKGAAWTDTNGSTGFTVNRPSGAQNGDFMIAVLHGVGDWSAGVTPPSGWTIRYTGVAYPGSSAVSTHVVMTKFAGASEPSSYTGTFNVSVSMGYTKVSECVAYRNVNATTPFIAYGGATAANTSTFSTSSVTNTNSGAWRVCSFGAVTDSSSAGSFSETEVLERADNEALYNGGFFGSVEGSCVAVADSNGTVGTGSYSRTGYFSQSAYSGAAWIGLLNPLSSAPAGQPNETSRSSTGVGAANPWMTTGAFDSNGVVATGATSVTGAWATGSGADMNSAAGWVGLVKPAAPTTAGYVSATMATTVDVSALDQPFDTRVAVTASFLGSAPGTPYLTCYFYRANQLLSSAVAQGNSFGTSVWVKSAATFALPDGTTRMKVGVSAADRAVADVVSFDRISLAYGPDTVYRPGTSRAARPVWSQPQIQYADDDGSGYTPWADLPGAVTLHPVYDPLSGVVRYADHTVVPLVNRKYRARTLSHGLAGDRFVSGWGPDSPEFSFVASNWWLKDIENLSASVQLSVRWDTVSVNTTGTAQAFQPLGTDLPVVLSEGFKSDVFTLTLVPVRRDTWAQLKQMLGAGKTLFLQSDTDHAWWVRPTSDITSDLMPTNQRQSDPVRTVKVTFMEVAPLP